MFVSLIFLVLLSSLYILLFLYLVVFKAHVPYLYDLSQLIYIISYVSQLLIYHAHESDDPLLDAL